MSVRRARGGFTLVEVMLALALIVGLLGAMMGFVWDLSSRRDRLARAAAETHAGCLLIDRIEGDLLAGLAGTARHGAGVRGTATSLLVLSRGVGVGSAAAECGGATADLQFVEVWFHEEGGEVRAKRGAAGGDAETEVAARRVERMRLRYFSSREWHDEFDSEQAGALPVAVEVALWFGDRPGDYFPDAVRGERRWRAPDRLRVITVADGPVAAWRESR